MSELPPMELRPMRATDYNLVLTSWLRSFAAHSYEARDYTGAVHGAFSADYVPVIRQLMARSQVMVLCLTEEPDAIIGWMAWEGELLHYVLVKRAWRRLGIARIMLKDFATMPVVYTHRTRRWVPEQDRVPNEAMKWCPVPKGWAYRRWLIWPKENATCEST